MSISKYDFLTYFLVLVIIVSLASIGTKLTGYVTTDEAILNITVTSTEAINFTTEFVNFGSGAVNTSASQAIIDTEGTVTNGTWSAVSSGFVLENIGNINVTLSIASSNNASEFIGGTTPAYLFKITDTSGEDGACVGNNVSTYMALNSSGLFSCDVFGYLDTADSIDIDINLTIPYDSNTGQLTSTITATATAIP